MRFTETPVRGAYVLDVERHSDDRGFFARTFCAQEFQMMGLKPVVVQTNVSFDARRGTLRGLHYQDAPVAETRLVRCVRGAIFGVAVDLRPRSATYLAHVGVELTAENRRSLYVPELCAYGFQTLTDDAEVEYLMGEFHAPHYQRGVRCDDPALAISWPLPVTVISPRDAAWPLLSEVLAEVTP